MLSALVTYYAAAFRWTCIIVLGTAAVCLVVAFVVAVGNVVLGALTGAGESGSGEEEGES